MTELSKENVGYFKYKSQIPITIDCIKEYPITEEILDLICNNKVKFEIEKKNEIPVEINGKFIVLI